MERRTMKPRTFRDRCDATLALFCELIQALNPPPEMPLSDWAEENVWFSNDQSSQPGPWSRAFAPYQAGMLDAIGDRNTERVVIMSAARVGKTVTALIAIAFHIAHDPCPIFMVYPTEAMGKKFSKKALAPFIRDCAVIRDKIAKPRSRDSDNTVLLKMFPGGSLQIAGANSPNSLRGDTARIAIIDEVDGSVELREGDYVTLAERRTATFEGRGRKIILTSTPTTKAESRIEQEYLNSTMERWHLPCPSCRHPQPLDWQRVNFETVTHACRECGALHGKREWLAGEGQWIAENPESLTRGFHVNALVSPFVSWESLIAEWRIATTLSGTGDHAKLQVFINTVLGETWAEPGARIDDDSLMARREAYYADVPDGVCAITIATDTQDNRLAVDVIGWGAGKESWRLSYAELWGDPRVPGSPVWPQLDEVIQKPYAYANGLRVPVVCTVIDMGGHAPDQVCTYAKARQGWNVWAVRGVGGTGKLLVHSTFKSKVASATAFNLGVDTGKDEVMARLRIKEPGPGYCHFPRGEKMDYTGTYESTRGYDARYFAGLTAEKKVSVKVKGGFHRYEWQKQPGRANEPFDLAVYNTAALAISKVNLDKTAAKAPWMLDAPPRQASDARAKAPAAKQTRRAPLNKRSAANPYTQV